MSNYTKYKKLKQCLDEIFWDRKTYGDTTSLNNFDTVVRMLEEIKYTRKISDDEKANILKKSLTDILKFINAPTFWRFRAEIKFDINTDIKKIKLEWDFTLLKL